MQDEDQYPPKPKWIGWAIIIGMTLVVLGMINLGVRLTLGAPAADAAKAKAESAAPGAAPAAPVAPAVPQPQAAAGKTQVEASDCMRCHGVERRFVGPAFTEIADHYRERTDAQAYLAGKIRAGSVGVWGRTIMPRHPQVTEEQALLMAGWIMGLPTAKTASAG